MLRSLFSRGLGIVIAAGLLVTGSIDAASADGNVYSKQDGAVATASGQRTKPPSGGGTSDGSSKGSRTAKPQPEYLSKDEYAKRMATWKAQVAAAMAHNGALATSWDTCVSTTGQQMCGQYLQGNQALPGRPDIAIAGDPTPAAPAIPPEVIAYQAVAELTLTAPKPVIGPPPEMNRWKTAVVGYPLWLAVDGDPTPPAVSDSVYDVAVSLQASLDKVVFTMGDGTAVTCTEPTHPWTRSVAVSAKSPWCGHTYTAVPKGSKTYTVTANAYWSVRWQINGATGTLPFYQSSSVQLPVSELQVLTR